MLDSAELTATAEFKDPVLEHEYEEAKRAHDLARYRRLHAVLLVMGLLVTPFYVELFAPVLVVWVFELVVSTWGRCRTWIWRNLRRVSLVGFAVCGGTIVFFSYEFLAPANRRDHAALEPRCFFSDFYFIVLVELLMACALSTAPGLKMIDAVVLSAPLLPSTWAIAAQNSDFEAGDHGVAGFLFAGWVFLLVVLQSLHVNGRRTWFLVRRLEAEDIFVTLAKDSALSALTSLFSPSGTPSNKPTRHQWLIPMSEIAVGEELGAGSYGVVMKGSWRETTVAIKRLHSGTADIQARQDFQDEIALLLRLRHPNVVLFMGVAIDDADRLLLVTEFVPDGSLDGILEDSYVILSDRARLNFALEIARGMAYLHGADPPILHRDLKPQNLLVDGLHIKIADFGLSGGKPDALPGELVGTPLYMSPEVMMGDGATQAADVWSYGLVANELWTRVPPYMSEYPLLSMLLEVIKSGTLPELDDELPTAMEEIVRRCLRRTPGERPSFSEIAELLRGVDVKSDEAPSTIGSGSGSGSTLPPLFHQKPPSGRLALLALDFQGLPGRWRAEPRQTAAACIRIADVVRPCVQSLGGYVAQSEPGAFLIFCVHPPSALQMVEKVWETLAGGEDADLTATMRAGLHFGMVSVVLDSSGHASDQDVVRVVTLNELAEPGELVWSDDYKAVVDAIESGLNRHDPRAGCWRRPLDKDAAPGPGLATRKNALPSLLTPKFAFLLRPEDLEFGEVLGRGTIGEVVSAMHRGQRVAAKRLFAKRMSERGRLEFLGQIGQLVALRHRNLATVLGAMLPPPGFVIVSAMSGPSLRQVLDDGQSPATGPLRADLMAGLGFLHGHGVVHGRLTSSNVLVVEDAWFKICDYGLESIVAGSPTMTQSVRFYWSAPELLCPKAGPPTPASDVYSAGVVLWEAATRGRVPYDHIRGDKTGFFWQIDHILAGERPQILPGQLAADDESFVRACFSALPDERPVP